jgi:hypothetical protein
MSTKIFLDLKAQNELGMNIAHVVVLVFLLQYGPTHFKIGLIRK